MKRAVACFIGTILCLAATSLRADNIPLNTTVDFNGLPSNVLSVTSVGNYFTTINGTNVDVVAPSNPWGITTGVNVVDLGGTNGNSLGQLLGTFDVIKGDIYTLTFNLGGSQRLSPSDSTLTQIDFGTAMMQLPLASDAPAADYLLSFTATATGTEDLLFTLLHTENPNIGSLLSSVNITEIQGQVTPTPEPTSLLLLGSGLAALAGYTRRRFGKSNG